MAVEFTQYLLPDGRKRKIYIEMEEDVEEKAQQIRNAGLDLECEVLATEGYRNVSFTITHPGDGDLAIKICSNGMEVPETVRALIMDFNLESYKVNSLIVDNDDDVDD